MLQRPVGWRYESARHSLAAKGVRTGYFLPRIIPRKSLPQIELKQIEQRFGRDEAVEARRLVAEEGYTAKELADHYGLPYLRKLRLQPLPLEREGFELGKVEVKGHIGPRAGVEADVSEEEAVSALLRTEGRLALDKELRRVRNRMYYLIRARDGANEDLAKAEGVRNISSIDYLKGRIGGMDRELEEVKEKVETMEADWKKGALEKYVPPVVAGEVRERFWERTAGPKRAAAIEEAKAVPVEPVVLSEDVSWKKGAEPVLQTRITKFMARRITPGVRLLGRRDIEKGAPDKETLKKVAVGDKVMVYAKGSYAQPSPRPEPVWLTVTRYRGGTYTGRVESSTTFTQVPFGNKIVFKRANIAKAVVTPKPLKPVKPVRAFRPQVLGQARSACVRRFIY